MLHAANGQATRDAELACHPSKPDGSQGIMNTLDVTRPAQGRSAGLDLLRVIGIAAVVLGHVWTDSFVSRFVYSWHVPLFFFLSGYLWRPGRTFLDELRRRFSSLLIPYTFWLCIISVTFIPWLIATSGLMAGVKTITRTVWGGQLAVRPYTAFWFVTALFFSALLMRAAERFRPHWILGAAFSCLVFGWLVAPALATLPLSVGLAPIGWFFMVSGRIASQARRRGPSLVVGLSLLTVGLAIAGVGLLEPLNLKLGDLGTPVLSMLLADLICMGAAFTAESASGALSGRWQYGIALLGQAGLVVVLTHAMVLQLMSRASDTVSFIVAMVLPWGVGLALLSLPWRHITTGVPRACQGVVRPATRSELHSRQVSTVRPVGPV